MARFAQMIGHVMMSIGNNTYVNKTYSDAALRTWAEIEYNKDKEYAYEMLKAGKLPDLT